MFKNLSVFLVLALIVLVITPPLHAVSAAFLQFEPSTVNTSVGQTFEAKINVTTGSDQIAAVDIYISYDQDLMELQAVNNGQFFPTVHENTSQAGKIYIYGGVNDLSKSEIGTGTVARLNFKSKKVGNTDLTFDCIAGSTTDSNIIKNDQNASDVIQCSNNGKLTLNVVSSSDPTSTPVPTSGQNPTATSVLRPTAIPTVLPTTVSTILPTNTPKTTLTELPRSGIVEDVFRYSLLGIGTALAGGLIRLILL